MLKEQTKRSLLAGLARGLGPGDPCRSKGNTVFRRNRQKNVHSAGLVGVQFLRQGMSLAQVVKTPKGRHQLKHLSYIAMPDRQELRRQLEQTARHLNLHKSDWSIVLAPGEYQLLLVDIPEVPEEEVEGALRFRVGDLISYSLDDAIVDVIRLPENAYRGRSKMAYVAVAPKAPLQELTDLMGEAGLKLRSIDIADLAMRNLSLLASQQDNVGVLQINQDHTLIDLCHKGYLCLNRRIETGLDNLLPQAGSKADDSLQEQSLQIQFESLILEIQRSFDYFESQLGLGGITDLQVLVNDSFDADQFSKLANAFSCQVNRFRPLEHLAAEPSLSASTNLDIVGNGFALGAALRDLEVMA